MSFKLLSPCGILGYGFPIESFMRGMEYKPDAIVVDAGSTDAGPHKLGSGVAIVSRDAYKKDLLPILTESAKANIPVIIGSAGGAGARVHVEWSLSVIQEIVAEHNLAHRKTAVIWADIPKEAIHNAVDANDITPLGYSVPTLTHEDVDECTGAVAQMGDEPILRAIEMGADVIVCGRAYDPAPFAAIAIHNGCDAGLAYHMGKILECAALCAEPGTTKDCMLGIIDGDHFDIVPLSTQRICTKTSVAAHTFYEKDHPYLLHGPGIMLDLSQCQFSENGDGSVRVTGSKLTRPEQYTIKLEGATKVGYRSFVIAGVRDPILISRLDEVEQAVKAQVQKYFAHLDENSYHINFMNYGQNGVMGDLEPVTELAHEVGVVFEVIAPEQKLANDILSNLRSTFLHYGYTGRKSTAGNLAFPFAPSDVPFGPVYRFSLYHLMNVPNGLDYFPIEWVGGANNGNTL